MFKGFKLLALFVALLLCIQIVGIIPPAKAEAAFSGFITRSGDKLMDGTSEFRFIGIDIPNLTVCEDGCWHQIDPAEQEDAIKTLAQMGATATRAYVFSVKGGTNNGTNGPSHYNGPGQYNDALFKDMDKLLQLCNQYGIRVIFPIIDNWSWWGGTKEFAAFRGKTQTDFYTDPTLKQDYKDFINYIVNRTNSYTGVKYKDDKAILAWQLGNEMYSTDDWVSEMAAYIKSVDSNHLVADGGYVRFQGIKQNALNDANVDIIDAHIYGYHGYTDMVAKVNEWRNTCKGYKPFILGEFGIADTTTLSNIMDAVISNGTSGALLWSLRYHRKDGGFYWHTETTYSGITYKSYHYPGFTSGSAYDETNMLDLVRNHAYQIRGLSVPAKTAPDAPQLLSSSTVSAIKWFGSVGAQSYDIERAASSSGPWSVIASSVDDSAEGWSGYNDATAQSGTNYYYRIKAKNSVGVSGYSNVVGPLAGIASNKSVYKWNGSSFVSFGGSGKRISVDGNNNPWIVNSAGELWQYDGSTWQKRVSSGAQDVGCGGNGAVVYIGPDIDSNGGNMFKWNGSGWDNLGGKAKKVDIDQSGGIWVLNGSGEVWQWNADGTWSLRRSGVQDIGCGYDGTVAAVDNDTNAYGGPMYKWNGSSWTSMGGNAKMVDVDSNGTLWVVNSVGEIWSSNSGGTWTKRNTSGAIDIGCGPSSQFTLQ